MWVEVWIGGGGWDRGEEGGLAEWGVAWLEGCFGRDEEDVEGGSAEEEWVAGVEEGGIEADEGGTEAEEEEVVC